MLRWQDDHGDLKSRDVRTRRFLAERAARRSLSGQCRTPSRDAPSVPGQDRAPPTPPSAGPPFNALVRVDTVTGNRRYWQAGETPAPAAPIFIPKSTDAPEGDGRIMTLVERRAENRSDIVIRASTDLRAPVSTIKIRFRLCHRLHGKWLAAADPGW